MTYTHLTRRRQPSWRYLCEVSHCLNGKPDVSWILGGGQRSCDLFPGFNGFSADGKGSCTGPPHGTLPNQLASAGSAFFPQLSVVPICSADGFPGGRRVHAAVLQVPSENRAPAIQVGLARRQAHAVVPDRHEPKGARAARPGLRASRTRTCAPRTARALPRRWLFIGLMGQAS